MRWFAIVLVMTVGVSAQVPVAAATEVYAVVKGGVVDAGGARSATVWLVATAAGMDVAGKSVEVRMRIPLTSSEDVYGESRSCKVGAAGRKELTFSAGLEEKNFAWFGEAARGGEREYRFLLNKYLCRAMAAAFRCGDGTTPQMVADVARWRFTRVAVEAESDTGRMRYVGTPRVERTGVEFDYARCAVVAPSNGMCCVQKKETAWHCGGTPVGEGWKQVSGECFHRETGKSCVE